MFRVSFYECCTVGLLKTGTGLPIRCYLLCSMYVIATGRFLIVWLNTTALRGEDLRWVLWRKRWASGEGIFGIRNLDANHFAFYHTRSLVNIFVLSIPLALSCNNAVNQLQPLEVAACSVWLIAFILELVADFQLYSHKENEASQRKYMVCRSGLWAFSRHPNYFFQFFQWVCMHFTSLCYA